MTAGPLCRYCGQPIPKRTQHIWVRDADRLMDGGPTKYVLGPLYTKADCQRHSNHQVVSVSYRTPGAPPDGGRRRVSHFTVWDGESYADEFFCKGACAQLFGRLMARGGHCTTLYTEAAGVGLRQPEPASAQRREAKARFAARVRKP